VPIPRVPLPLPIGYKGADGREPDNEALVELVREHCDKYFAREIKPHWPDAWIDYSKARVGYEIPIAKHFFEHQAPRPLHEIERDIELLEGEILAALKDVA
jgi:type I restriction enzyme M protein